MLDDVWVVELSKHLDLSLDLFENSLLLDLLLIKDLNCNFMACNLVVSD